MSCLFAAILLDGLGVMWGRGRGFRVTGGTLGHKGEVAIDGADVGERGHGVTIELGLYSWVGCNGGYCLLIFKVSMTHRCELSQY